MIQFFVCKFVRSSSCPLKLHLSGMKQDDEFHTLQIYTLTKNCMIIEMNEYDKSIIINNNHGQFIKDING